VPTLVDGLRILVDEAPETVVERVVDFRASLLLLADKLRAGPSLSVVRDEES
jgi:uncharacterized protein YlzI (FlbEa/FlbD family)